MNDLFLSIIDNIQEVIHHTIQYVDDSTNIISSNDVEKLQKYINNYFLVIESFYNINKLLINSDKSKLLISCKPKYHKFTENNQITV